MAYVLLSYISHLYSLMKHKNVENSSGFPGFTVVPLDEECVPVCFQRASNNDMIELWHSAMNELSMHNCRWKLSHGYLCNIWQ